MNAETPATGPIVVYGATGYTGRLIAAELAATGREFVLAGRDRQKLEALASDLETDAAIAAVPNSDSEGLRDLFADSAAVIACAGPFYLHGEPILAAAVDAGTHYLDTTGEQPFIRLALDHYGPRAAEAGSAVIPGMGFDYLPGDMLAALTAEGMGPLETVRLGYITDFQPTRGTMRSALDMIKGTDMEWRDGHLLPASQRVNRGRFDFGGDTGIKFVTRYPAGEHITVPRHVDTKRVESMLSADSMLPGPLARISPLIMRPAGLLMRTPVKDLAGKIVDYLPEGADPEARADASFRIACEVRGAAGERRGTVTGKDVYGLTAALLVKGAEFAADGRLLGTGGLAPAEAFDPHTFPAEIDGFSLKWLVEPRE